MLFGLLGVGILVLSVVLRLASVFHLTIPILYALIVPTLFHGWFYSHTALAYGIWYILLGLTLLSWVVSLFRRIRELVDEHQADRAAEELLAYRIRKARENGETTVSTEGLYR